MILSRTISMYWLLTALVILTGGRDLFGQTHFTPDTGSRLWIEGSSNVNQFRCDAGEYDGEARILRERTTEYRPAEEAVTLNVEIRVSSFECGRKRMNRDLTNALKADRHPLITFQLLQAETISSYEGADGNDIYRIRVSGKLTVAGVSRELSFTVDGSLLEDGRLHTRGEKTIRMTDFEVEPPSGLMGLVRADDELTVHFDLYATPAVQSAVIRP